MLKHVVTNWNEFSPPAYVSNGFIGFRFAKNPFKETVGLLSGFYGVKKGPDVEAFSVIPTPNITFYYMNQLVEPQIISQSYDFSTGELETSAILNCGDKVTYITYMVFCSRTSPTLLVSSLKVKSDKRCRVRINIAYQIQDGYMSTVSETEGYPYCNEDHDGKFKLYSSDKTTTAGVSYRLFGNYSSKEHISPLNASAEVESTDNDSEIQLITSYVPGIMHSEPHNQAHRLIKLAAWNGFERIRNGNHAAWAKLWESRIVIDGAQEEWQNVIDASYFYLMSSMSAFAPVSVAPYGLSQPDGYEGHCFWDTESFMFMTPLFCAPDIACSMLEYRFRRLEAAKNNARLNGYSGIQFPWQSGTVGCEVTVPFAGQAGGAGEQHVNLDVALAFDAYAKVSGDECFLKEKAWPVLKGVADWIVSRAEKTPRGYEILHVTGIDEESDDVPNDSYTNIMSKKILYTANEYSEKLGFGKNARWSEVSETLWIPSREDGVLPQYEGMPDKDNQASTTLMAYFPYGYTSGNDIPTFEYYINHGMERYLNYPMLSGFLGVFPAWAGDREKSLAFYEKANLTFFCDPFYACTEWGISNPKERKNPQTPVITHFITARGSLLSGLIMGLTKICPWKGSIDGGPEEWLGENIILPEGWKRITIGKVYIRGKAYKIIAENGAKHAVLQELPQ